jgi:hypothetical protein
MREVEISEIVSDFLTARGYRVYAEVTVPRYGGSIDLVATRDDLNYPAAIELKAAASRAVFHQAYLRQLSTPYSWVVVATKPRERRVADFVKFGIGLATVKSGKIEIIARPSFKKEVYSNYAIDISLGVENGKGGTPSPAPAKRVALAVCEYCKEHENANWQEIYENVPNHYSSSRSMASAIRDKLWTLENGRRI